MKTLCLLFIISLFNNGVFGDTGEVKTVSVMEGDSVTLHTDLTDIQRDHVINWRFEGLRIAQINKAASKIYLDDSVLGGKFRGRLHLDDQTGDLTVANITTKDSGLYQLQISDNMKSLKIIFNISGVFNVDTGGMKTVSVMEGDSVTLHTDVTDIKKYDVIRWRFQHHSPLAEINRKAGIFSTYDDVLDGRFRDRLQVDDQTGSLTITNIRTEDTGLYQITISSSTHTIHQSLTVTVRGGVKTVSITEDKSVTLHTDVTEIQTYDLIQWMFGDKQTRIAEIYQPDSLFTTYDGDDGIFRDRLKLNDQTGSLTITNTRTEHSGVYELKISSRRRSIQRRFIVTVSARALSWVAVAGIFFLLLLVTAGVLYIYCRFCDVKVWDKQMSVMEGGSVTLHTDVTEQRDHVMEWMFLPHETIIARLRKANNITYDGVNGRFKNRLKLNNQTGDLTITDIRTDHSGVYELKIIKSGKLSYKRIKVTVYGKLITVNEGDSVTLATDVTEIQRDEKIQWRFHEDTLLAEIDRAFEISSTCDGELFRNTLELNHQTGDLTIKNISRKHTGVYTLKTILSGNIFYKRLYVSVTDSLEISEPLMNIEMPSSSDVSLL